MTTAAIEVGDRVAARDFTRPRLSADELDALYARTDVRPALHVLVTVAVLGGTIWTATVSDHVAVTAVAVLAIGALQHRLSILQHEAVHYLLFRSRRWNEVIGSLVAFSIGFSLGYRTHHLQHHRRLGTDDDPDLPDYAPYPASPGAFLRDLLWTACGLASVDQFVRLGRRGRVVLDRKAGGTGLSGLAGIAVTQLCLLGLFAWSGHARAYFILWLLPLLTVTKTLAHFRGVVEHTVWTTNDGRPSRYRTTLCGPFDRMLFAPMFFNYHAEHHFFPAIPYYRLPAAHRLLADQPAYREAVRVDRGYVRFLLGGAVRWSSRRGHTQARTSTPSAAPDTIPPTTTPRGR